MKPACVILFEDDRWEHFLPLVYLRGLFDLRCGASTLWQRVERLLSGDAPIAVGLWCRCDLAPLVAEQTQRPINQPASAGALLLNGCGFWSRLPDIRDGEPGWVGTAGSGDEIACIRVDETLAPQLAPGVLLDPDRRAAVLANLPRRDVSQLVTLFDWPWELVNFNAAAIESDWHSSGLNGSRRPPDPGVFLLNPERIHIGAGTRIKPCVVIDAEDGPVWIGANVTIQPHVTLQGPCYIGNECLIQAGAVIGEGCSFGRRCKVGGEIEASIIQSFSNKQHDGFLGHSYLGEWINIGAGCISSDLKNTYGLVRVPINGRDVETQQQFAGTLMGDFTKTGINVSFPTGAVVGVCSNIVTPAPSKFTPSFAWVEPQGRRQIDVDRGLQAARRMMSRRHRELTPTLEAALRDAQRLAETCELHTAE